MSTTQEAENIKVVERVRLNNFVPQWEGIIEQMCRNIIHKNLFRVIPDFEFDDLYQEAYCIFHKCKERYRFEKAQHAVAMVRTCLNNRIITLANKRTKRPMAFSLDARKRSIDDEMANIQLDDGGKAADEMAFELLMDDCPPPIRRLLEILQENRPPYRHYLDGRRETTQEYFSRLIGEDARLTPIVDRINAWLNGSISRCA